MNRISNPVLDDLINAEKKMFSKRQQHCDSHPCHVIVLSLWIFLAFLFNKSRRENFLRIKKMKTGSKQQCFSVILLFQQPDTKRNTARILITKLKLCNESTGEYLLCFVFASILTTYVRIIEIISDFWQCRFVDWFVL